MRLLLGISLILVITACSDDRQDKGHVWQEQMDTIQKAEEVNELIMDTDQQRREAIDRQSQ